MPPENLHEAFNGGNNGGAIKQIGIVRVVIYALNQSGIKCQAFGVASWLCQLRICVPITSLSITGDSFQQGILRTPLSRMG